MNLQKKIQQEQEKRKLLEKEVKTARRQTNVDSNITTTVEISLPPLSGYLHKLGEKGLFKSWKKRWFFTFPKERRIYYAESDSDTRPLGFIDMEPVIAVAASQTTKFGIDVVAPNRTYYLQAANEPERQHWIDGLRKYQVATKGQIALPTQAPTIKATPRIEETIPMSVNQLINPNLSKDEQIKLLEDKLKEVKDNIQKDIKSAKGLEKLIGFYASDKVALQKTQKELEEHNAKLDKLQNFKKDIESKLNELKPTTTTIPPVSEPGEKIVPIISSITNTPPAGNFIQAEALYDFAAESENELSFKAGDILTVYEQGEIWFTGELNGLAGSFPANYVKILDTVKEVEVLQAEALFDFYAEKKKKMNLVLIKERLSIY